MIISISGKIGSGKDTVGKIIQYLVLNSKRLKKDKISYSKFEINYKLRGIDSINYTGFEIKKFADSLKDIVCLLINCTREELEDPIFKNKELGEEWWSWQMKLDGNYGTIIIPYTTSTRPKEYNSDSKLIKPTPRYLLQNIGTDLFRSQLNSNVWVNALFSKYKVSEDFLQSQYVEQTENPNYQIAEPNSVICNSFLPKWIITDMRFPNELQAVKDRQGITIRVNRGLNSINGQCITKCNQYPNCKPCGDIKLEHISETALDNAEFDYTIDNNGTIEELIEEVKQILIKEKII